jgi:transcriptional regulator with GAF, ATPase, and Fis domain
LINPTELVEIKLAGCKEVPMTDEWHLSAVVPRVSSAEPRVLLLQRPASRRAAPTVRANAIVFEDPLSLALQADLDRLAPSDASLIVVGETGTGKELVARYLHEHSRRSDQPFVAVNCGALVETLVEAELFGYERGAFTGAIKDQVGWFEAANGGTLFLDEIGDLPLPLQVKLLRVLQEREVVRLGARKAVPIDVRIVAATNVDLEAAVTAKRFRQDLFFRLNVASVCVRPLRERPGDIPALARHFLGLYGTRMERSDLALSPAALNALASYSWPGNIRELENIIHNAVLLAIGPTIEPGDFRFSRGNPPGDPSQLSMDDEVRALIERSLARDERDVFERVAKIIVTTAFNLSGANQVRAAERLGLTRNAMRTQLARAGIIAARAPRKKPAD